MVALPSGGGINQLNRRRGPGSGTARRNRPFHDESTAPGEEVYVLRVRGTADLELSYEIVQPNGTTETLPVSFRRAIGLVRLVAMIATTAICDSCKARPSIDC